MPFPFWAQSVGAVWGNSRCLLWEPYRTRRYTVWAVRTTKEIHHISTTETSRLMLFGGTVAVYYENHTEHKDTLFILYLTGNTSRLCCRAQPVNAVLGKQSLFTVRTIRDTQIPCVGSPYLIANITSATQPKRLILFGETRCLLSEPYGTHRYTVVCPYLTGNTSRLRYTAQQVNAVWRKSRCVGRM
jgi:hypothetical protein